LLLINLRASLGTESAIQVKSLLLIDFLLKDLPESLIFKEEKDFTLTISSNGILVISDLPAFIPSLEASFRGTETSTTLPLESLKGTP